MDQTPSRLIAVLVANVVAFVIFLKSDAISTAEFRRLTGEVQDLLPGVLGIALLTVVNGLTGSNMKARLVFLRWSDPLPGCRAFTEHAPKDPRVDMGALSQKLGEMPTESREQNATWYRLYRSVKSDPAVVQNHRDFLFTRDYAALSALMLVGLGGLALYQFEDWKRSSLYIVLLAAQYAVVRHVAARYGSRFVSTALAVAAAEE